MRMWVIPQWPEHSSFSTVEGEGFPVLLLGLQALAHLMEVFLDFSVVFSSSVNGVVGQEMKE